MKPSQEGNKKYLPIPAEAFPQLHKLQISLFLCYDWSSEECKHRPASISDCAGTEALEECASGGVIFYYLTIEQLVLFILTRGISKPALQHRPGILQAPKKLSVSRLEPF